MSTPSKLTTTAPTDGPVEVVGEAEVLAAAGTLIQEPAKSSCYPCGYHGFRARRWARRLRRWAGSSEAECTRKHWGG